MYTVLLKIGSPENREILSFFKTCDFLKIGNFQKFFTLAIPEFKQTSVYQKTQNNVARGRFWTVLSYSDHWVFWYINHKKYILFKSQFKLIDLKNFRVKFKNFQGESPANFFKRHLGQNGQSYSQNKNSARALKYFSKQHSDFSSFKVS